MSILDTAVAIADKVTQGLKMQATVLHQSVTISAGDGARTYPVPAVQRPAIVEKKQQLVKTTSGEMVMSQASVLFLSATVIGIYDQITLPDGTTGPILNTGGFVTSVNPILTQVYLG